MTDNNNQKRGTSDDNHKQRQSPSNNDTDHIPTYSPNSAADKNGPSSSLASRIHNSASGLARSAFSASSSASGDAASLLAGGNGSKAGASTSSRAAFSAAQRFEESGAPTSTSSSSAREHPELNSSGETFRSPSTTNQQNGGFTLPSLSAEEFQSSYSADPFSDPITPTLHESPQNKGKGKAQEPLPSSPPTRPLFSPSENAINPSPLPTDGLAVTTLLSSPTFDPEFPPSADEPFTPIETDLAMPAPLTAEERQTIDSFRRQMSLPPSSSSIPPQTETQTQKPHRLTPYSLVPDIGAILDSASAQSADVDATALRDRVLTSLPGSAEWVAVDERYHDEVWGYLRPALEAARVEMESKGGQGEEGGNGEVEGPAVRRLKMILKHMAR